MRPLTYVRASTPPEAVRMGSVPAPSHETSPIQYLGGGTQLLDLAKLDVIRPTELVDITRIADPRMTRIEATPEGLRLGALVTMRHAAEHPAVVRDYPVLSESLWKGASQQIRNMGRLGGNVLQRTRCEYFRDTSWRCNKRQPGSGCDALDGINRWHAVLGVSDHCIASYPGDWAIGMIALDASVDILGVKGPRTIRFADLHREPGDTPHIETNSGAGRSDRQLPCARRTLDAAVALFESARPRDPMSSASPPQPSGSTWTATLSAMRALRSAARSRSRGAPPPPNPR